MQQIHMKACLLYLCMYFFYHRICQISGYLYEKKERICDNEKNEKSNREIKLIIPPGGFDKFIKSKSNEDSKIIVKSKLPLARPIVFKHMESSFDVFHG